MINFVLYKNTLIERNLSPNFTVLNIFHPETIQECIDDFNAEISWKDMFTIDLALQRIQRGEQMFAGYYGGQRFGYCWLVQYDNNSYIYNVFSKKLPYSRPYGATDLLYWVIKNHGREIITANVDKWNTKSIRVFEKLGFKPFDNVN